MATFGPSIELQRSLGHGVCVGTTQAREPWQARLFHESECAEEEKALRQMLDLMMDATALDGRKLFSATDGWILHTTRLSDRYAGTQTTGPSLCDFRLRYGASFRVLLHVLIAS